MSYSRDGHPCLYDYTESVALDVAESITRCPPPRLDEITSAALVNSQLFSSAFAINYHLATYFIIRCCYEKDTTMLITETLRAFYKTTPTWSGNDIWTTCLKVSALYNLSLQFCY